MAKSDYLWSAEHVTDLTKHALTKIPSYDILAEKYEKTRMQVRIKVRAIRRKHKNPEPKPRKMAVSGDKHMIHHNGRRVDYGN